MNTVALSKEQLDASVLALARRLSLTLDAYDALDMAMSAEARDAVARLLVTKSEASASLVAAAPDLLSALKGFLSIVDESRGVTGYSLDEEVYWAEFPELEAACAAIDKAEGQSSCRLLTVERPPC